MQNQQKTKIEWLSILQGWSMLLVVIGHVVLTDNMFDDKYPMSSYLYQVIYSFHMALFIFISGWLLYYTSIAKNKSFKTVIKSKVKRLLIPFYVFTIFTILIKLLLAQYVKRPVDVNEIIETFILYSSNPLKEIWLIVIIIIMNLRYHLYLYMIKTVYREIFMLVLGVLLFLFSPNNIHVFFFHKFIYLYFFFILGIITAHHRIIEKINLSVIGGFSLCLFIAFNVLNTADVGWLGLINRLTGILFSTCLCLFLSRRLPSLFSSFRDYTFQIYLVGMFPQMALRVWFLNSDLDNMYGVLFFTSIAIGIYIPVFISRILKKYPTVLNPCLGL